MSSDAARLEALGEPTVRFRWRRHTLTIPRAIEEWPLDLIRRGMFVDAAAQLLNGQTAPVPLYGDLISLSDAMAEACGVSRLPETKPLPDKWFGIHAFGAVPILLDLLDSHEDDIASDLRTFRHVDYLDRWRGDLTLRQIWVYIRRLPPTSALAIARNGGNELWTKQAILTAQVWERLAGRAYVGRPMTIEEINEATAAKQANDEQMSNLADKQDYYSPEASRARAEAAAAKKAAAASPSAPPPAPAAAARRGPQPPAPAIAGLEQAMANRRAEIDRRREAS